MEASQIAKILPTKFDGGRTIGTGYPITENLVLTARHVVIFKERNDNVPIQIEWTDLQDGDGKLCKSEATEIIEFGESYDIALLRCKVPAQAYKVPPHLAQRFPAAHEQWAGFGYPRIGKDDKAGTRDKIPAMGKFHPPDTSNHKISLTSESDALEKEGWCGISGAPVFQGNRLYAVISETPKNRQECFAAVLIPWLFKHKPEFCRAVGLDIKAYENYLAEQERQIQVLLNTINGGKLFEAIALKLNAPSTLTPDKLAEKLFVAFENERESLFLRKIVLGIPAQAIGKNLTRLIIAFGAPAVLLLSLHAQQGA